MPLAAAARSAFDVARPALQVAGPEPRSPPVTSEPGTDAAACGSSRHAENTKTATKRRRARAGMSHLPSAVDHTDSSRPIEGTRPGSASLRAMMGELEAVVVEVRPWDVHGVGYVDVTVVYPAGPPDTARLGPESVPEDLGAGERVMVTKAVNMIVGIRRA